MNIDVINQQSLRNHLNSDPDHGDAPFCVMLVLVVMWLMVGGVDGQKKAPKAGCRGDLMRS